jgi:hypothetical protein
LKADKYVLAAAWGALATLAAEAVSLLLVAAGMSDQDIYRMDSLLATQDNPSQLIGLIVNFIVGGFSAAVLCYLMESLGARYAIIKGIMASLFVWLLFNLYSGAYIEGRFIEPRPAGAHYNQLISALANGAAMGVLFRLTLFRKKA